MKRQLSAAQEIDSIEDVRRCFESSYTNSYFDPYNGDWMSDDYYRIIDLTTQPAKLDEVELGRLDRSIQRLNQKYEYIQRMLGREGLVDTYTDVMEQINSINMANPDRAEIPLMQATPTEQAA